MDARTEITRRVNNALAALRNEAAAAGDPLPVITITTTETGLAIDFEAPAPKRASRKPAETED